MIGSAFSGDKNIVYDLRSDDVFKEKIECDKDYEDGSYTVKYNELLKKLKGTSVIETLTHQFELRDKGLRLLVLEKNQAGTTINTTRKTYDILEGKTLIKRGLVFPLVADNGEKSLVSIQYDSQLNSDKILIVKYIDGENNICSRGLIRNSF